MQYNTKGLLDFIAKYESRGDYNAIWGGISRSDYPNTPLTKMTIGQVLAWQDSIDLRYMSEAAGRYQILEDTLRDLYKAAGLRLNDLFNEQNQDRLAEALLQRRGLSRFVAGEISANAFANQIAREWASMPVVNGPKRGQSYYAGDGLNKAHASVEGILAAIETVRPKSETSSAPTAKKVAADPTVIGTVGALVSGATAAATGDGNLSKIIAVVLVVAAVAGGVLIFRKYRKG